MYASNIDVLLKLLNLIISQKSEDNETIKKNIINTNILHM